MKKRRRTIASAEQINAILVVHHRANQCMFPFLRLGSSRASLTAAKAALAIQKKITPAAAARRADPGAECCLYRGETAVE